MEPHYCINPECYVENLLAQRFKESKLRKLRKMNVLKMHPLKCIVYNDYY